MRNVHGVQLVTAKQSRRHRECSCVDESGKERATCIQEVQSGVMTMKRALHNWRT